jgi:hypothetical protein
MSGYRTGWHVGPDRFGSKLSALFPKLKLSPLLLVSIGLALVNALTAWKFPDGIAVGPIHILLMDSVLIPAAAMGLQKLMRRLSFTPVETIFACILVLSVFRFAINVPVFGTGAFLDFRATAVALFVMLYLLEYQESVNAEDLFYSLCALTASSGFLAVGRVIGILPAANESENPLIVDTYRLLSSSDALPPGFLCVVCLLLMIHYRDIRKRLFMAAVAAISFGVLIASLQRTVTIAVMVAIGVLTVVASFLDMLTRREKIVLFGSLAIAVAGLVLAVLFSPIVQLLVFSTSGQQSTFQWRVDGWRGLLGKMDFSDYLFGMGPGADMGRWTNVGYVTVGAHSFYVEQIWVLGISGFLLYMSLFVMLASRLLRVLRRSVIAEERATAVLMIAFLIGLLVFSFTYSYVSAHFVCLASIMVFCHKVAEKYPNSLAVMRERFRVMAEQKSHAAGGDA